MHAVFVDGGITPYNNPAFQAFLMATVEPYAVRWPSGEERLLVVSIGTGTSPSVIPAATITAAAAGSEPAPGAAATAKPAFTAEQKLAARRALDRDGDGRRRACADGRQHGPCKTV